MVMQNRDMRQDGAYSRIWTQDTYPPVNDIRHTYENRLYVESTIGNRRDANPFLRKKWERTALIGTATSTHPDPAYCWRDEGVLKHAESPANEWYPGEELTDAVYNDALARLNDKARGSADLSIDIAQYRQTHRMARNIGNVVGMAQRIRRSWQKTWRSKGKSIGDLWLEQQYGLRPLLSTIFEAGSLYMDPTKTWDTRVTARAEITDHFQAERDIGYGVPVKTETSVSVRHQFILYYRLGNTTPYDRLVQFSRYTSLNPASIAYELLPWSFVVDWFYNVGGYMRAYETALLWGGVPVRGSSTQTHLVEWTDEMTGLYKAGGHQIRTSARGSGRYSYLKRTPSSGWPFPRSPHWQPKLGWQRLTSAAALLTQLLDDKGNKTPRPRHFRVGYW